MSPHQSLIPLSSLRFPLEYPVRNMSEPTINEKRHSTNEMDIRLARPIERIEREREREREFEYRLIIREQRSPDNDYRVLANRT